MRHFFGIPDEEFIRGDVPMTKCEIRKAVMNEARIEEDSIVLDVGAGTGSISIEAALAAPKGHVYAIERFDKGIDLINENIKKFNVNSIKNYLCNGIVKGTYKRENPMYAYKVYNNFKIYRPLADKYTKWRNNLTDYDIQGYEQLPQKGDILFITKSMKDVMCLHEMGYPAVSPSSESTFLPKDVLEQLKTRFKRIIILFDRDTSGVKRSRKLSRETGLEAMFINKKFKAKDVSDAVKANSFEEIKNWLNETIKNYR